MASDYHRLIMPHQVDDHVEQMIEEHKDIISMIEKREKRTGGNDSQKPHIQTYGRLGNSAMKRIFRSLH